MREALIIGGALIYLTLPCDLIPDVLPVLGWLDDVAVAFCAYRMVRDSDDPKGLVQYIKGIFK